MSTGSALSFFKKSVESLLDGVANAIFYLHEGIGNAVTNFSYSRWFLKKDWQTFKRTYLSHYLAAFLCFLVIWREWDKLSEMALKREWPDLLGLLVLFITVLTFIAAALERFGNKLTTSPQEIRFQFGVKELLEELHNLRNVEGNITSIEQNYESFVQRLLDIAAKTFSARSEVHTGLMVKLTNQDLLKLVQWSGGAQYDEGLEIPIPTGEKFDQTGPAGLAFKKNQLVYVPKKDRDNPREAWPFQTPGVAIVASPSGAVANGSLATITTVSVHGLSPRQSVTITGVGVSGYNGTFPIVAVPNSVQFTFKAGTSSLAASGGGSAARSGNFDYLPSDPHCCWKKSSKASQEDFRTVLCVPIDGYGVLNFSTKMRDPFIDRDFFMAEFFANILRHAEALTRRKKPLGG